MPPRGVVLPVALRYLKAMKRLWTKALLAGSLCLATLIGNGQDKPAKPDPDIIVFTNGDQLKGSLVRAVGQNVTFKSDMAGEITVSLDKVKELHVHGQFAVLRKDVPITKQPVKPGSIDVEDSKLTITIPSEPVSTLPVTDIGFVVDQATYQHDVTAKAKIYQGWNGSIGAGATIIRSTQNGSTYNAAIALVRTIPQAAFLPPHNRTTLDFTESYGKITQPNIPQTDPPSSVETKTSIMHADLERDRYFSPRFYALGELAFDHNFSSGLDLQQIYGGGFGWTPIQKPNQQLDLKADVHYEKQAFETPASNQNLIGSTFAENYRRNLPRKLVLTETASIIPAWNNTNAYSANAQVVLAAPVFNRFNLTVTTSDNFINNPAFGYKKNTYQFITGISYTLH